MTDNTVNLSLYGYSDNYSININGVIYNITKQQQVKMDDYHRVRIKDNKNNSVRVYLKPLYRKVFNKEFCIDNIVNLPQEEWKPIKYTCGIYFVSNYGRFKSYNEYNARILKQDSSKKGYLSIKINGKNYLTHRIIALYFVDNPDPEEKTIVHHKDKQPKNNMYNNLQWVSHAEHVALHKGVNNKCSTT